jgi:hypothetical protein
MDNWKDKYDFVDEFYEEGRTCVKLNNKYGFVDTGGNEVVPLKYDRVGDYYESRAWVELNGKYGFVDLDGNEIVPLKYDWVNNFYNGRAYIIFMGCKGEIDLDGREYFSQENLAKLRKYRLPQIIDSL